MLIVLVLAGLFFSAWYLVWKSVRPSVLGAVEFRVGPGQVEITPTPKWINSDIRAEVFREPSLNGPLSIMDDDLVDRIANAFSLHPWVAKVRSVKKQHPVTGAADQTPVSVKVELDYRRPVCMVEVPGGLLPVDAEGVLLPSADFSPIEAGRYPRLVDVDRKPAGPPGQRWADARVIGGAEIAVAVGPAWDALKLQRIAPLPPAGAAGLGFANVVEGDSGRRGEYTFCLITRGGTRIFWGYPPGANAPGELPAAEKIARLQRYQADHDTLDGPRGRQELDVRTLRPSVQP
jgi:hypothetical protein